MSIFQKIFGAPAATPQPQGPVTNNPATNPPPQPPHSSAVTEPNGQVPAGSAQPPEDKFAKLWETEPSSPNGQNQPNDNALTPEKMLEAASKVDFTKVLDQASLQKIAAGGEEAVAAMAMLLNKTAQSVYGQSTVVAQKLIESQLAAAREDFAKQLPSMVKRQNMQESLLADNPAFKKPSVAPVVSAIQSQLASKFPNASAAELNEMAREYMREAAQAFSPTPAPSKKSAKSDDIDWDTELGIGS